MRTTLTRAIPALIVCIWLTGCGSQNSSSTVMQTGGPPPDAGHGHPHEGPHGGRLIDVGRNHEYHAELVEDRAAETVTVYIVDHEMKELPIEQRTVTITMSMDGEPKVFELSAVQSAGDGKWTRFQAVDKELFRALKDSPHGNGKLHVTIAGTPFVGRVARHQHEPNVHVYR